MKRINEFVTYLFTLSWMNLFELFLVQLYISLEWALNTSPRPHFSINLSIQSTTDLTSTLESIPSIVEQIDKILPQLTDFISQFNTVITSNNVNVITDQVGNMSIDVPIDMSDSDAETVTKKIGIIDRLITTQGQKINDLFQKGLGIEQKLMEINPEYKSAFTEKIVKFKELNASYKH